MTDSSLNNISFGKNLFIAASIGTAFISPTLREAEQEIIPTKHAKYSGVTTNSNLGISFENGVLFHVNNEDPSLILSKFITAISSDVHPMNEDIQKVVNENFWDMI